ncbi:putative cytochrome b5 [Terfezia boudieri ATCC MYA-4762]|uniref:Putative cytochrome b5 n=1 Tax=Terfezia boudieri ATCC MYA-4762 TaxID=1051890 RepID=A0A3N4LJW1_9PEZI|nr:putative cytochrome b5 [Terfezia boudieri ATCC MYA-4762]
MADDLKEFTYDEVRAHNSKKDLWLVIEGRVYDITPFVDEHPGGEEVLLDVAGQDSTEAFDDVGHSDEAREILANLLKGSIKGGASAPKPIGKLSTTKPSSSDSFASLYIALVAGVVLAVGAWKYLQIMGASAA